MKKFPIKGLVFWAVGTGDSVTVCIDKNVVMQIDLHNLEAADDDDDPRTPIIDRLKELLPKKNNKPYLPLFVLTHPDLDHCKGFARLLTEVTIGEIWFAPRIFREAQGKLCDDAIAFRKEAKRRVKANKAGNCLGTSSITIPSAATHLSVISHGHNSKPPHERRKLSGGPQNGTTSCCHTNSVFRTVA